MNTCKFCGNLVTKYVRRSYCSEQCYQKMYYQQHKDHKREYDKAHYVPHPRKKIILTEDELEIKRQKQRERRQKYYLEHLEYYRQKNKEYYLKNKNNPKYRTMHNEAVKRYLKRRRQNKLNKEI